MLFENLVAPTWPVAPPNCLLHRIPPEEACRIVTGLTAEMLALAGGRGSLVRRDRRRASHARQISMYVCHVVLQLPQGDIAQAFGRDRSTVSHACGAVEDRRDERDFDAFVSAVERLAQAVFATEGGDADV